jgi:hypothetical protein
MKNTFERVFEEWLFGDDKGYNPFLRAIAISFGGKGDGRTDTTPDETSEDKARTDAYIANPNPTDFNEED